MWHFPIITCHQVGTTQNDLQDVDVVYYDGALVVPEDMSGVQILDNSMSPDPHAGSEHDDNEKEIKKRKNANPIQRAGRI